MEEKISNKRKREDSVQDEDIFTMDENKEESKLEENSSFSALPQSPKSAEEPLIIRAFIAEAKMVKFDQENVGEISFNVKNFSHLWCLCHSYSALKEKGYTDLFISNLLQTRCGWKEIEGNSHTRALKQKAFNVSGKYNLNLDREEFFDVAYIGAPAETKGNKIKNRKKFHINIQARDREEYFRVCTIAGNLLAEYEILKFKFLTWVSYSEDWSGEQFGKNISIFAYKQINIDWKKIITHIDRALRQVGASPSTQPLFDLPLTSPYWSARSESTPDEPDTYKDTAEIWEYYYETIHKAQLSKNYLRLIADSSPSKPETLAIYDAIQQRVYESTASEKSNLDIAIEGLSNKNELSIRRKKISDVVEKQTQDIDNSSLTEIINLLKPVFPQLSSKMEDEQKSGETPMEVNDSSSSSTGTSLDASTSSQFIILK